ncbi:MerR family transcriptional regulator [Roseimicrobium sp. ORNL1]|uniref:MerR family transcriptional regulator n=1 Tax=Roseimicrobium sp. ORNL1 TaxID=2711231 RepID=UPI0013E1666B|nr:MerR family transcriptional regulator [Roseimicrobium sp. ORNL1]QIF02747.1 MerR family transcriptional regulator [Roseimicrobium sp. ORNL1]
MSAPSRELRHPIKVVCHRTGLTAHVIRVWERRYGLVCCQRTDSNRRLYSDEEIERLRLLKQLTGCGHRISQIACLCLEELYSLHKKELPERGEAPAPVPDLTHSTPDQCQARCMEAVKKLDCLTLTRLLEEACLRYGARTTLLRIVSPLVYEVGEAWRKGELRVSHEHLATNVVRDFLAIGARCYQPPPDAPELVVTTPSGQCHEVGALLASAVARDLGWRATYLGPSLAAEEIAACVQTRRARAVALSLVYPSDDPNVPAEITKLRQLLPPSVALLMGGRAAFGYHRAVRIPDVRLVDCLASLEGALEELVGKVEMATDPFTGLLVKN